MEETMLFAFISEARLEAAEAKLEQLLAETRQGNNLLIQLITLGATLMTTLQEASDKLTTIIDQETEENSAVTVLGQALQSSLAAQVQLQSDLTAALAEVALAPEVKAKVDTAQAASAANVQSVKDLIASIPTTNPVA